MNARQMKKCLKKQIDKLQSDNDLMHGIIADSPKMQELYNFYTEPLNNIRTTMPIKEFRVKREIPAYTADLEGFIEYAEQAMAKELFNGIRENITYKVDANSKVLSITASIFVGKSDE